MAVAVSASSGARPYVATHPRVGLFWLLQGAGWATFGVVMYLWALAYWTPVVALLNKGLLVGTGIVLTLAFRPVYARLRRRALSPVLLGVRVLAITFVVAPVWYECHALLLRLAARAYPAMRDTATTYVIGWTIPTQTWLFYGFVLTTWSLLYFLVHTALSLQLATERAAQAEALAATARLRALQAQIQPHFLFNALNSISTLVTRGRLDAATTTIAHLGDLLRASLTVSGVAEIPLSSELDFVRAYLSIEQVRFCERLAVRIDAAPDVLDALVPPMILQPLVENALRHGVLPRAEGGSIAVRAEGSGSLLRLSVEDDGVGWPAGSEPRFGVGLTNTSERLAAVYGRNGQLALERSDSGFSRVLVTIPRSTGRPKAGQA